MILSIENLRTAERYLKNAYRAVRAASYSASGGFEPESGKGFDWPGTPGLDLADIRAIMAGSTDAFDAAENVLDEVSDYIL
jgi:hypothetical protein